MTEVYAATIRVLDIDEGENSVMTVVLGALNQKDADWQLDTYTKQIQDNREETHVFVHTCEQIDGCTSEMSGILYVTEVDERG